jgi:phage I-like protein
MVNTSLPSLPGLALNFETGTVPDWVQLTPAGPAIVGRDGRGWKLSDPEAVARAYDPAKEPQIDLEHSSQLAAPAGLPAPAVGWIKAIEVRDGALWGRVEWTKDGEAAVASRAYRYLSPVFQYDWETSEILRIASAGLTNSPNLEMAALNAQQEKDPMDKAVLEALGLQTTATSADAVVAINNLKIACDTALNAAQTPDPAKFVPKADHDLALNRITTFETAAKAARETEIVAAVDAAVTAGKVAPASKDYHLAFCRTEGGLEQFRSMIAAAPVIAAASGLDGQQPPDKPDLSLNAEAQGADIAARARTYQHEQAAKGLTIDIATAVNHVQKGGSK